MKKKMKEILRRYKTCEAAEDDGEGSNREFGDFRNVRRSHLRRGEASPSGGGENVLAHSDTVTLSIFSCRQSVPGSADRCRVRRVIGSFSAD